MLTLNSYSGISWAHSGNARLGAKVLTVWDETNTDYVKIPSAIKFDPPNDVWGINTKNDPDAVRWFKLLLVNPPDLDEEVRTSDQVQKARNDLQALHMPPIEAISTYLKHMFKHAQEKLKLSLGAATVDSSRFHVVFTVPAIWPEYARRSMQAAIKRAGILEKRRIGQTTHDFISEPEAAALATLSDLDGLHDIKAGKSVSRSSGVTNIFLGR
jgi:molecular chaperone DnaK (HSP70)